MKKIILIIINSIFIAGSIAAADDDLSLSVDFINHTTESNVYYNEVNPIFTFELPYLTVTGDLSFINDGKYQPDKANSASGTILGYYTLMNNGCLKFDFNDISIKIGQNEHNDVIESDYSLFISSNKNPAFTADLIYDGDFLYYETRWIRLNENSAAGFDDDIDRGANFKTYALKLGDFRIGFQDAAVYLDKSFDLEYFINPLPQYFIQYVKIGPGRPWKTESNENNLIGAFLDYTVDGMYFYGQYLMDDFNLHWLLPDTPHNPNKMAYAAGGRVSTGIGEFSFDAAMAFKYTFQATYVDAKDDDNGLDYSTFPYEYTYFPSSSFIVNEYTSEISPISYIDNYIGYKYGENNIAVQVNYENSIDIINDISLNYKAGIEYIVSGSKSPSNPWHELNWHENEGTKLFDELVLEHTIKTTAECISSWKGFSASIGLTLGYVFNHLTLTEVVPNEAPIFIPKEGFNKWIFDISLGLGYKVTLK